MNFRRSLIFSALLHLALLLVGLITFPSATPHRTSAIASIPVDLISEEPMVKGEKEAKKAEVAQTRATPAPVPTPEETPPKEEDKPPVEAKTAPAPPPPAVTTPPEEKQEPPPPEKSQTKPDEVDPEGILKKIEEAKKLEEKKKQEELKKAETKKKAEEKKKLAEEKRKAEQERLAKQAKEFDADKISNLLNKQEGAPKPKAEEGEKRSASLGSNRGTGTKLTKSQVDVMNDMIRRQVEPCWVNPTASDLIVKVKIPMNRDGSIRGRPQVMNSSPDPTFRILSEAAVRAVMRCSPLKLPAEMYDGEDGWEVIDYNFNDPN